MLKNLKLSDFLPLIGNFFQLQDQLESELELKLMEAVKLHELPSDSKIRPDSFSLLFKGPIDRSLSQRIYCLYHNQLGELEIFLVPVESQVDGICYEAIFT